MNLASKLFSDKDTQTQEKLWRLLVLFVFAVVIFVFGVTTDWVNSALAFERDAILQGQIWRLFSCNLVHLSSNHMFMNLSVYVLAVLIFGTSVSLIVWYAALLVCFTAVGLGLLLFYSNVVGYVGLSGALYGIIVFGLLVSLRQNLIVYLLAYVYVTYKVLAQQFGGYDSTEMAGFIGGNVIAQAHLLGLIAGNLCAGVYILGLSNMRGEKSESQ